MSLGENAMTVLARARNQLAIRLRFSTVASEPNEGAPAFRRARFSSPHSHRVFRQSLRRRLNGVGLTPLSRFHPTLAYSPKKVGPIAASTFDGRHTGGVASVCWSSEAQWACEPDPLPELAVAPGLRVAPYARRVGGGSRFPCAKRPNSARHQSRCRPPSP